MTSVDQISTCPTELLILFHYHELDDAEHQQVEQHLLQCRSCRTELGKLQEFLDLVPTDVPELTAVELKNFKARVVEQLPRRRYVIQPAFGWALTGAFVLMLSLNLRQQTEPLAPTQAPMVAEQEVLNQFELLQNLELLENLDLLQQLARQG